MNEENGLEFLVVVVELQAYFVNVVFEVEGEDLFEELFLLFFGELGGIQQFREHCWKIRIYLSIY